MDKYLFRVSLDFSECYNMPACTMPVYVVSTDKENARTYAEKHLRQGVKVKSVSKLGRQLGNHFFRGK
jgi:hypothetical protein